MHFYEGMHDRCVLKKPTTPSPSSLEQVSQAKVVSDNLIKICARRRKSFAAVPLPQHRLKNWKVIEKGALQDGSVAAGGEKRGVKATGRVMQPGWPTLMTATPPASLAMRSLSFSVSYTLSVSANSFLICTQIWAKHHCLRPNTTVSGQTPLSQDL